MRNPENFGDVRQTQWCCLCGGVPDTDDHVPSKVFLDQPHPDELPTVGVCYTCNNGLSKDEVYVSALVECVLRGTTDIDKLEREKIKKAFNHSPALQARIGACKQLNPSGETVFHPEWDRVNRVALKLLRGHALFELNEPHWEEPVSYSIKPAPLMTTAERVAFEEAPGGEFQIWPEVGSRAMQRVAGVDCDSGPWLVVQPNRYRYLCSAGPPLTVRVVVQEYLFAEAIWD